MSAVERYLTELGTALHVRGSVRRRFLRECRDHLADAAAERGEEAAVRAFGPAPEIAAGLDAEVAARRGVRSTFATVAGVLATGGSTLALIHASSPAAAAPVWWAITFFVAAQLAAVSAGLALVQALVVRRSTMSAADAMLLARRNGCALAAVGVTMFSAGAAVPGQGSAILLLAGPALVCVALVAVLRACSPAQRRGRAPRPAAARGPRTAHPPPGPFPRQPHAAPWSPHASPPRRRSSGTSASTRPSAGRSSPPASRRWRSSDASSFSGAALGLRHR